MMGEPTVSVLNELYSDSTLINQIKKNYGKSQALKTDSYELIRSPFRLLKLNDLLTDCSFIDQLKSDLEKLDYLCKNNDLYSLKQSRDLNCCDSESISNFLHLLRSKIEPMLTTVMGAEFNGTLSVTASLYRSGDYLLCHDDRCNDRCVAFVYYLNESTSDAGGHYRMFAHDVENGQPTTVACTIPPEANSLVCFEVGNLTYHEVSEVLHEKFQRLTINGWFHSNNSLILEGLDYIDPMPPLHKQVIVTPLQLDQYITRTYCLATNISVANQEFEKKSFILLKNFFKTDFFKNCAESLNSENLSWTTVGPANRRNYDSADLKSLPEPLVTLMNFFKSPVFINYLKDITGLDLVPISAQEDNNATEMIVQIQKWTPGCYTMATDNDAFFHKDGLDMMLYLNCDKFGRPDGDYSGCTTYLSAADSDNDSQSSEAENELLTVEPVDNALVLIYRTSDTIRFTKYINHFSSGVLHAICATYFEPET